MKAHDFVFLQVVSFFAYKYILPFNVKKSSIKLTLICNFSIKFMN